MILPHVKPENNSLPFRFVGDFKAEDSSNSAPRLDYFDSSSPQSPVVGVASPHVARIFQIGWAAVQHLQRTSAARAWVERGWCRSRPPVEQNHGHGSRIHLAMDQYLLIPFLGEWTSIDPSYFDVHQGYKVLTHPHLMLTGEENWHGFSAQILR